MKLRIEYRREFWLIHILLGFVLLSSCRKDPIPPQVTPPYNGPALCKTQLEQISVPANNMDTTVYNVGCGAIPEANQLYAEYLYTDAVFNPENINQIAYVREPSPYTAGSGARELWVFDICTGEAQKIHDEISYFPLWGRNDWILFSVNIGGGSFQIFKIKSDGSQITQLTYPTLASQNVPYAWNREGNKFIFLSSNGAGLNYIFAADDQGNILDTIYDYPNGYDLILRGWLNSDTLLTAKTPTGAPNPSFYVVSSGIEITYFSNGGSVSRSKIYADLSNLIWMNPNSINKSSLTAHTVLRTGASNRRYNSLDLSADNQYVIFSRHNERNPTPCDLYQEDKIYIMSTDGSYERELILP